MKFPVQFKVQGPVKDKYQVLGDHSVVTLAATVNRLMDTGWTPLGAPFQRSDRVEWCQAMVYTPWSLKVAVDGPGPVADVKPEDVYKLRNEVAKIAAEKGEVITPMAVQSVLEKERKEVRDLLEEMRVKWDGIAATAAAAGNDYGVVSRYLNMGAAIRLAIIELDIRSTDQLPK